MKFSFLVSLRVSNDSFVRVDSHVKLPIQKFPTFYTWSPAGLALDGYDMDSRLQLEFVLSCDTGNILAKRVEIGSGELNYNKTGEGQYHILKKAEMEMSYSAVKYMEDNKTLGRVIISIVSLKDFNPQRVIEENKKGHKITCRLNEIYLGRPQECISLGDEKRSYYWYPTLEDYSSFEGLSPREDLQQQKEEDADLALIKMACPSGFEKMSSRKSSVEMYDYIADNDCYRNDNRRLPLYIEKKGRNQKLSFYNFKFTPPKCAEVNLIWSDFVVKNTLKQPNTISKWGLRRRSTPNTTTEPVQMGFVEYPILKDLKAEIFFEKVTEDKVKICSLQLKVLSEYERVLEMNEIQKAITI
jgi:hypothetical protein